MCANPAEPIRIVYFGTPTYAVPALEALLRDHRAQVTLVVTQPDRPAGRGRKLTPPPVKDVAVLHGVSVYQPEFLRTAADREPIAGQHADLFVVAAFGKIFGPKLLALPRLGAVNLHASLLPQYRGASPISAAILEGRNETGITLMRMDTGLDTGPILAQRPLAIDAQATTASLTPSLAQLGAELLIDSLGNLTDGSLAAVAQEDGAASMTRPLVKADGWIDWQMPAVEIERQVRAMWDWPRAWTTLRGELVQIHRAVRRSLGHPVAARLDRNAQWNSARCYRERLARHRNRAERRWQATCPARDGSSSLVLAGERLGNNGAPDAPELPMIRPGSPTSVPIRPAAGRHHHFVDHGRPPARTADHCCRTYPAPARAWLGSSVCASEQLRSRRIRQTAEYSRSPTLDRPAASAGPRAKQTRQGPPPRRARFHRPAVSSPARWPASPGRGPCTGWQSRPRGLSRTTSTHDRTVRGSPRPPIASEELDRWMDWASGRS